MRREINSEELSIIYQATGQAIWHLQYVEDALCQFYIIYCIQFGFNGFNRENAESKLAQVNKKTLGQLIGLVEKTGKAPSAMLDDLKKFNSLRKWVVHNSMRENGNDLYSDRGREEFVLKVVAFTDMAISIHDNISEQLMGLVTTSGFATEEQIIQMANLQIERLKGKA